MAWDYPIFILATFATAAIVAGGFIRSAGHKPTPSFDCIVCGRRQLLPQARDWRYCPYCGAPKDAVGGHQLPRQRRSEIDL